MFDIFITNLPDLCNFSTGCTLECLDYIMAQTSLNINIINIFQKNINMKKYSIFPSLISPTRATSEQVVRWTSIIAPSLNQ